MYGVSVCYGAIYLKRDDEVAVFYLKYKKGGERERERERERCIKYVGTKTETLLLNSMVSIIIKETSGA